MSEMTPLLGLVMIVKNEAHGIAVTLKSFLPFIDTWTILDTGSTDDTRAIIEETLSSVPGQLFEEPFVDFSTTRNRALALHGTKSTFVFMPDSDDVLEGGEALRSFCELHVGETDGAYNVTLSRAGHFKYNLALLMRTRMLDPNYRTLNGVRYVGKVHEYLHYTAPKTVPGVTLLQDRPAQSAEMTAKRWLRDLDLLAKESKERPQDTRTAFYFAQTLECLGRKSEALEAYRRRAAMVGGYFDETFVAKLRAARLIDTTPSSPKLVTNCNGLAVQAKDEKVVALLDVHAFDPRRPEPLIELAKIAYLRNEHALTYLFAACAFDLPEPEGLLFYEPYTMWEAADLVAISASYLCRTLSSKAVFENGRRAAVHALERFPDDERLQKNLALYNNDLAKLFA